MDKLSRDEQILLAARTTVSWIALTFRFVLVSTRPKFVSTSNSSFILLIRL
jgi:hypothetical protein